MINVLRRWAEKAIQADIRLLRVGFFGSDARGDWGVGSDFGVVIMWLRRNYHSRDGRCAVLYGSRMGMNNNYGKSG